MRRVKGERKLLLDSISALWCFFKRLSPRCFGFQTHSLASNVHILPQSTQSILVGKPIRCYMIKYQCRLYRLFTTGCKKMLYGALMRNVADFFLTL